MDLILRSEKIIKFGPDLIWHSEKKNYFGADLIWRILLFCAYFAKFIQIRYINRKTKPIAKYEQPTGRSSKLPQCSQS